MGGAFGGERQTHAVWQNIPSGDEGWAPNPDCPVPVAPRKGLSIITGARMVHGKPILRTFPVAADLKDLTVL